MDYFLKKFTKWLNLIKILVPEHIAYIDVNADLRKKSKKWFSKRFFFKLMNNAVFGKTVENVRKYRDVKLVTTDRRRNWLIWELNYHTTKFFRENLLAIEIKKQKYLWINLSVQDVQYKSYVKY